MWYAKNLIDGQGLVIEEKTGTTVAVVYDKANTALVAAGPALRNLLKRLTEKVERANNLQHSRKSHTIPQEDWSELYSLTNECRAILYAIKEDTQNG